LSFRRNVVFGVDCIHGLSVVFVNFTMSSKDSWNV
jgi:hypothetical protein